MGPIVDSHRIVHIGHTQGHNEDLFKIQVMLSEISYIPDL